MRAALVGSQAIRRRGNPPNRIHARDQFSQKNTEIAHIHSHGQEWNKSCQARIAAKYNSRPNDARHVGAGDLLHLTKVSGSDGDLEGMGKNGYPYSCPDAVIVPIVVMRTIHSPCSTACIREWQHLPWVRRVPLTMPLLVGVHGIVACRARQALRDMSRNAMLLYHCPLV